MLNLTIDEVQELVNLTPEQEKAWRSLERAFKKCHKVKINLYQVLDTLHALNGNNVKTVAEEGEVIAQPNDGCDDNRCTHHLSLPSLELLTDSFADDNHIVILR